MAKDNANGHAHGNAEATQPAKTSLTTKPTRPKKIEPQIQERDTKISDLEAAYAKLSKQKKTQTEGIVKLRNDIEFLWNENKALGLRMAKSPANQLEVKVKLMVSSHLFSCYMVRNANFEKDTSAWIGLLLTVIAVVWLLMPYWRIIWYCACVAIGLYMLWTLRQHFIRRRRY